MRHLISSMLLLSGFIPLSGSAQSIFDSLYEAQTTTVYFNSGKYDLDIAAQKTVDLVASNVKNADAGKTFRITAHTDSVGSTAFNDKLAAQRAETVVNALRAKGLTERIIQSVRSFGESMPASTDPTEAGLRLNRRVVIEVARQVPMRAFTGQILDAKTGEGLESIIRFQSGTRADSVHVDSSGRYTVRLPADSVVNMEVQSRDHFFESTTFEVLDSIELFKKYNITPDIELPPADTGETLVLQNLYFEGDKDFLLPVSEPELPKILRFMQSNPDLIVEIGGHINAPYPENHNFKLAPGQTPEEYVMSKQEPSKRDLSTRRARRIYDWLIGQGIPAERMTYKGYDNNKMLFPHSTKEPFQQLLNRRVEIMVTGKL